MEEDKRRKGQNGDSTGASLQGKYSKGQKNESKADSNTKCYNCHKNGHMASDCWAKGGRKEGQRPKGQKGPNQGNKSNQAQETNSNLNDIVYMAVQNQKPTKYDWYFDTATTSHICTQRDAFTDHYPLQNSTVDRIRPNLAIAAGHGTMLVNFSVNGKIITHQLSNVLHVPNAANCLLSGTQFDESGGIFKGGNGKCVLRDETEKIVGRGNKINRLYLLDARAQLLGQERTNYTNTTQKQTWDQWHKSFRHIAIPSLKCLSYDIRKKWSMEWLLMNHQFHQSHVMLVSKQNKHTGFFHRRPKTVLKNQENASWVMLGDQLGKNPLENGNIIFHLQMTALTMCMFFF